MYGATIFSTQKPAISLDDALDKIEHYAAKGGLRTYRRYFSRELDWLIEADEAMRKKIISVYKDEINKNSAKYFIINGGGLLEYRHDSHIIVAKHSNHPSVYLSLRAEEKTYNYLSLLAIPESAVSIHNGEPDLSIFAFETDYAIKVAEGEGLLHGGIGTVGLSIAREERLTGKDYELSDKVLKEIEEKIRRGPNLIKRVLNFFNF